MVAGRRTSGRKPAYFGGRSSREDLGIGRDNREGHITRRILELEFGTATIVLEIISQAAVVRTRCARHPVHCRRVRWRFMLALVGRVRRRAVRTFVIVRPIERHRTRLQREIQTHDDKSPDASAGTPIQCICSPAHDSISRLFTLYNDRTCFGARGNRANYVSICVVYA